MLVQKFQKYIMATNNQAYNKLFKAAGQKAALLGRRKRRGAV